MRFIFALLLLTSSVLADEWKVFSQPSPVYSAIPYDSGYVLATGGGIQFSTSRQRVLFTSADGLGATSFFAVAQTPEKIYGVSEYGLIVAYDKNRLEWTVRNRSFLTNKVRVVPGQAIAIGSFLVIAFEDRISFYEIDKDAFLLSIDKVGTVSLEASSPERISTRGDSLFVQLGKHIYARKMDWNNMSKDMRLADPLSWTKIATSKNVESLFKTPELMLSKKRQDTIFYNYRLDNVYEVTSLPEGGIVAATSNGWMAQSDGYNWKNVTPIWNGLGSNVESFDYRMKILSSLDDGSLLAHVWGMGLFLYKDNGYTPFKEFRPQDENSCLDEYLNDYTVVEGTTIAPDSLGFLAAISGPQAYGLAYITKEGSVSCLSGVGSSPIAGTLAAKVDVKTGEWIVYVSSKESFFAASIGKLDEIRISAPRKNGGRLQLSKKRSYVTPGNRAPVDYTFDKDDGSLWLITIGNLAYMDEDRDTLVQPSSTKGLLGAEYSSMESDVQGNIWLGSVGQGVFRLTKQKSKDTLAVERFLAKDGLMDDRVNDLAIDPVLGMAWFAHDGGVTRYSRKDLRNAEKMMTSEAPAEVKAYPNPFRPKHGQRLVIDNISEDSFVSIYNRGGSLVKALYDNDVLGGRAEWDGTDKTGKLVAPGVYHYVVRKGSKKKTGKIILIH